jgi:hypothetical protein
VVLTAASRTSVARSIGTPTGRPGTTVPSVAIDVKAAETWSLL